MSATSEQQHPTNSGAESAPLKIFIVSVVAAVVGLVVALSFGYADHSPAPHNVKIAVVAPRPEVALMGAAMDRARPGGFTLIATPSRAAAIASVRDQQSAGAFIVPAAGPATIVTAQATSALQATAISTALGKVAAHINRPAQSLDVAPLPSGDSAGLSSFVLELGLLIPSLVGSVGFFLLGFRHRVWWRVAGALLFSVLVGAAAVLVMDAILGALTGATLALFAVAVFGALTFVLTFAAIQALVGLPGTAIAALILVFTGNAMSGGTVPIAFLPGGFRQIAPWLPNSAIVSGTRDVIYFGGNNLGHPLLVLGLWTGVALCLFVGVDLLHRLAKRRQQLQPGHPVTAQALIRRLNQA